jgi:hypothetical protein
MWQHFRSDAVEVLLEKFTGFVRVPVEDTDSFQKWYDDLVEQQLLATAAGDRARAAFLSKKKTKVLRYALPQCFLEQFFHRHAARLAQDAVPDVRNSIAAADLRVAASILDFLDLQRPHFQTLSGHSYVAAPAPSPQDTTPMLPPQPANALGITFSEVAVLASERIAPMVAADTAAFVTAVATILTSKKTVVGLKEIHALWRALPEALARRVSKMQNAALSTLTLFQALVVTENARGPKITKVCRFPLSGHLNAAPTATAPQFSTHDACNLVVNAATPQPPMHIQWPSNQNVAKDLASANVPQSAMEHADAKVATARGFLRELRLVFQDHPPLGAPWANDDVTPLEAVAKRPRVEPPASLQFSSMGSGMLPPMPPPAELPQDMSGLGSCRTIEWHPWKPLCCFDSNWY